MEARQRIERIEHLGCKLVDYMNVPGGPPEQPTWTGNSDAEETARELHRLLGEQLGLTGEPATAGQEAINRPRHYTSHPSLVECVDINEHFDGNIAAAIKHAWRRDLKHATPAEDLAKMAWYLNREYWRSTVDTVPIERVHFLMGKVAQVEPEGSPLRTILECLSNNASQYAGGLGDACLAALEALQLPVKAPR